MENLNGASKLLIMIILKINKMFKFSVEENGNVLDMHIVLLKFSQVLNILSDLETDQNHH